jgi:1-acyl-sn-glycerol-3-phosphate acyltransferase
MRTIPIAPAKEDPRMKDQAFAEAARALEAGEIVGIFPEGRLTETGELNPFRPGVQQMIETTPVPVVPMALSGLWGSFFSRSANGKAMRRWRGIHSRIAFVVAPPVAPANVTLDGLQATVLALRGPRK